MYGQQASIDPSLAALLQTAQMVTPDGGRTVAANVAQAAAQKMQPQGIAQGMPQARQDFQAAMPSMMRNMQQAQMQQMVQQAMQPKPAGIEGLQSNVRMAEGGVVGYAGDTDGSSVKLDVEQILKKAPAARTPEENAALRAAGVALASRQMGPESGIISQLNRVLSGPFIREAITGGALNLSDEELAKRSDTGATTERIFRGLGGAKAPVAPTMAPDTVPQAMRTEDAFATPRVDQPVVARVSAPQAPAPRPPAQRPPAPAQAAPQAGIAQLVAPTPEGAMASARSVLGLPGTEGLRTKENAYLAALKAQPATGQQGLAALQAQQAALQGMHDKAEKESNINSAIQWLLGGREGPGGSARASIAFSEKEDARRRTYNDLQVANATKRDAIIDLQNAREVGNAKAALEAEQRIRAADMAVAKAEGELAASFATSSANVYGTQVRSQDEAANRANALKVAGIQAAAREGAGDIAQKRLALQQLKADPEYTAAMNKIKELSKAAGLSSSPTIQTAFRTAQQEALAIARRYGLTPQDIEAAGGDTGTAQRGTRENPIKLD